MANGSDRIYNLKPSYIDRDENDEMRKFQKEVIDFVKDNKERVAILDPPTGSGKTFSFKKIGNADNKTMIVLPNNLLAREVLKDFGEDSIILNKESILEKVENRKKRYNIQYTTISDTINEMLSSKSYILTNPTVFYFLLLNHYNEGQKDDMMSIIVKKRFKTIIFDEFHIYSKDQISMIMACAIAIPQGVKILFSSATPQDYFEKLCKDVFGELQVKNISVVRYYNQNDKRDLLQGPIKLNILNVGAVDFAKKEIDLFRNGKWVFILDSLRNVAAVGKTLSSIYNSEEIAFISAYNDPSNQSYLKTRDNNNSIRIIISTNIIEQGININKEFTNFVIEPGLSINNFTQRIGRVGRGINVESNAYVCLSSKFNVPQIKDNTLEEVLAAFGKMNFGKNLPYPNPFGIGVYLYIFLERLTDLARETIIKNVQSYNNNKILAGFYACNNVEFTFSNQEGLKIIKKNYFSEIINIKNWWEGYKKTIYNFIADESKKVNITDEDFVSIDEKFLKTEYDEIWVMKNKQVLERTDAGYTVGPFNNKVNYDFEVKIKNMPDGSRTMNYKDIAFSAKTEIMTEIKNMLDDGSYEENERMECLKNDIISIIRETAGIERLKMEVL